MYVSIRSHTHPFRATDQTIESRRPIRHMCCGTSAAPLDLLGFIHLQDPFNLLPVHFVCYIYSHLPQYLIPICQMGVDREHEQLMRCHACLGHVDLIPVSSSISERQGYNTPFSPSGMHSTPNTPICLERFSAICTRAGAPQLAPELYNNQDIALPDIGLTARLLTIDIQSCRRNGEKC